MVHNVAPNNSTSALEESAAHSELMLFAEDNNAPITEHQYWTVLIVDDDPEIHKVTLLALRDFNFQNHKLKFISAFSASEAKPILASNHDIALVLLDVVMETDDAGLTLVHYIRDTLQNHLVRIVLRTGQAGQAPEQKVVQDYDINDYRAKTELTVQRLTTTVLSALRAYTAIAELAKLNDTLEAKVQARTAELAVSNQQLQQSLAELEAGERAGKQVQFKMLPPERFRCGEYQFSHALFPSAYMSGDFVDYFNADPHRVVFYIADVSGHGVASAFVTVYLKRFVSSYYERYQRGNADTLLDPAAMLGTLNSELLRENITKYIALFYAVLDTRSNTLTYANAGAYPWPLVQQQQQANYLELKSTPAGMFDFSEYRNQQLTLAEHSGIVLCSDGLLDLLPQSTTESKLQFLLDKSIAATDIAGLLQALNIDPRQTLPDDLTILKLSRDVTDPPDNPLSE
ncbi:MULTISPECIES: SpoIIE family protein phosphatase [unclassified Arsukibacterium]|uniref:SpoIIE family protein phosphatase n=1 Tax=unclassified Arsukibacterium TaxID=2635278 RepID=UPI000C8BB955|nr:MULTISPECIES: SpoIIE family protein phosphatase [unclassified Arsukibacterium]MAA96523.1 serine/threonine protein phosphatase [Rheinheimera sp.]HAW94224.1 serine/threonine protein phosphatase [Candidatus Azambacteria bacterium]|tara:strand:- start:14364 stop:15737 length:1374 start_codon:yes stop_codon:yes gene_type:complete